MGVTLVSEREYADGTGMGKSSIGDARRAGRIVNGWDNDLGKYKFEIAEQEWGVEYRRTLQVTKGKEFTPAWALKNNPLLKYRSDGGVKASTDMVVVVPGKTGQRPPEQEGVQPQGQMELFGEYANDFKPGVRVDVLEAQRVLMVHKAREAKMVADELAGVLVRKDLVGAQLAVAGIEVRKKFEQLPVRVVDAVRAAKNRAEAIIVIEDAVADILERLGDIITEQLKDTEVKTS